MRILIAEDDPINRRLLEVSLRQWGYEVAITTDGGEAWEALSAPDAPRLVILDWMMPVVDGPELCRRIRALPEPRPLYLILLTARGQVADVVAGLQAGADDYIVKPFDPQELRTRVQVGVRTLHLQDQLVEDTRALESARAALAEQERFSDAVSDMSDAIVTLDAGWCLRTANRAAVLTLALPPDEWQGRRLDEMLAPFTVSFPPAELFSRPERVTAFEISRLDTHPPLLLDARLSRRCEADGQLLGAVLIVRDVTDERLPRHVQSNFMTVLPHKLRTPLALLLGYLGMARHLGEADLLKHWPHVSEIWERELQYLVSMVQKLLDFENLTVADLEEELLDTEVAAVVAEAVEQARTGRPAEAVELSTAVAEGLHAACRPDHLQFILAELLGNAIKFADKVPARVQVDGTAEPPGRIRLTVADNGPGIPHEYYDRIFDGFVQVEEHVTGQVPGFGLGLRMIRQVAEAYGGTVTVSSRLGEGTAFTVLLPAAAEDTGAAPVAESRGS